MASGRLGKAILAANTDTTLYTAPASTITTATVCVCNTSAVNIAVRLAIATSTAPAASDYLEFDVALAPGGVLERSGIAMTAGEQIIVRSSAPAAARAHGFEEAA